MLMQLRKPIAKVVTFALFGLLIMSFAVWGIGDIFRGPGQNTTIAEVGDTQIDENEFTRVLSREINRLSASFGGRLDFEQARALGIVDQVLGQLVNRALFNQQAKDMGMVVTEDQVKTQILREPAFQNQLGEFERSRFVQVLQASNLSEEQFIDTLRQDVVRQQIIGAVAGTPFAPGTLAEALHAYAEERRDAETLLVAYDAMAEPADPDDATLTEFYDEQGANFMTPETRSLTVIQLRAEDFAGEIAIADDALEAAFETRRGDFARPERRGLEQIVLDDQDTANQAKAEIDGGADFAAVAQSYGGTPIDLGVQSRDDIAAQLPAVADAAFAGSEGSVAGPVESPFGWHLVRVTSIEAGYEPSFDDVRDQLRDELALREAVDSMISIANQLDDELAGGAGLEEVAGSLDLTVTTIPAIDAQGRDAEGNAIEGLPPLNEFLQVVRETRSGEDSLLTETPDGNYFILRVDGITPATTRPLDAVRADVIALWKQQERERLARAQAEALAQRARDGETLAAIAETEGLSVETQNGLTREGGGDAALISPELRNNLFDIKPGAITTARGVRGVQVAKLVEIRPVEAGADPDGVTAIRDSLQQSLQNDLLVQFSTALSQQYDLNINHGLIDNLLTQTAY